MCFINKLIYLSVYVHLIHTAYYCVKFSCCALCRPGRVGPNAAGRGVLSMQGLSYGVVRVDMPNSLTSLTLQDCGQVLPGGTHTSRMSCYFCIVLG